MTEKHTTIPAGQGCAPGRRKEHGSGGESNTPRIGRWRRREVERKARRKRKTPRDRERYKSKPYTYLEYTDVDQ